MPDVKEHLNRLHFCWFVKMKLWMKRPASMGAEVISANRRAMNVERCSFCQKGRIEVRHMVQRAGAAICDACIDRIARSVERVNLLCG